MRTGNFDIRNPAWNNFVQRIAVKAAKDLGIMSDGGPVKAEIDRARLWTVGASLPPYKKCVRRPDLGL